jgi:hypothetical protein
MAKSNFAGTSPVTAAAGATITDAKVLKMSGATVIHATAEGDTAIGVSCRAAASGEFLPIQIAGIARVTAGAAITAGLEVECTTGGKVITAGGAASNSVGVAMEAALADGDVIEVLLSVPAIKGPANT